MENGELKKENIIEQKSFEFALRIIKVYKFLTKNNEYILSKQLLRSGTSIGANIAESKDAISKKDFRNKLSIALKEARETYYWLRLLIESGYLSNKQTKSLLELLEEIISILVKVVKNAK